MSTSGLADRNRDLGRGCGAHDEDDTQRLIGILRELLAGLDRPAAGAAALDSEIEIEDVERWDGDEYLYLEAALPSAAEAEIDVSIQGGRAFIRIARG